jgi:hypothetical protein
MSLSAENQTKITPQVAQSESAKITVPGSQLLSSSKDPETGRIHIKRANEINLPQSWDDIPRIGKSRGTQVLKPEDLIFVVELPLYQACRALHEAGIVTTESNAHFEPGAEKALMGLGIKWDSLNLFQKNQADKLCQEEPDRWRHLSASEHGDGYEALYLEWWVSKSEVTPGEVKAYVDNRVEKLIKGRIKFKSKIRLKNTLIGATSSSE